MTESFSKLQSALFPLCNNANLKVYVCSLQRSRRSSHTTRVTARKGAHLQRLTFLKTFQVLTASKTWAKFQYVGASELCPIDPQNHCPKLYVRVLWGNKNRIVSNSVTNLWIVQQRLTAPTLMCPTVSWESQSTSRRILRYLQLIFLTLQNISSHSDMKSIWAAPCKALDFPLTGWHTCSLSFLHHI